MTMQTTTYTAGTTHVTVAAGASHSAAWATAKAVAEAKS